MSINESTLSKRITDIIRAGTDNYRSELNKKIHVADLSFKALKQSSPYLTLKQYTALIDYFKTGFEVSQSKSLYAIVLKIKQYKEDRPGQGLGSILYIENDTQAYLIAGSYETLQKGLSRRLKALNQLSAFRGASYKKFTSVDESGKITSNIGHIPGYASVTRSPLGEELAELQETAYETLGTSGIDAVFFEIEQAINTLISQHRADVLYDYARGDVFKDTDLASAVVLVTLQSGDLNNNFSKTETAIAAKLKQLFERPDVIEYFLNKKGSNNILEDITERLMVALGDKRTAGSKHVKKAHKKSTVNLAGGSKASVSKTATPRLPQLRTTRGQFYGLVPLQRLLDATLVQRIKDNMGTGNRRDILNLRTGRFAESVKVENLSQSREGMITAFYSYMRNPYATFSQGGRQESPKTRDPKLLISQSIRQIGAAVVANRMRAVLV